MCTTHLVQSKPASTPTQQTHLMQQQAHVEVQGCMRIHMYCMSAVHPSGMGHQSMQATPALLDPTRAADQTLCLLLGFEFPLAILLRKIQVIAQCKCDDNGHGRGQHDWWLPRAATSVGGVQC